MIRIFTHAFAVVALTLLTQVGGVAYVLTIFARRNSITRRWHGSVSTMVMFVGLYASLSVAASVVASRNGRVPLPCFVTSTRALAMQSPIYCALNRHYVSRKLGIVTSQLAAHMDRRFPGTVTLALDGSFPLIDGFPLLPHLSHNDGRKLDLAFYYAQRNGAYVRGETKSLIGYWAFEEPAPGVPSPCAGRKDRLTMRWDLAWLQQFHGPLQLDVARTRAMLRWLSNEGRTVGVDKLFLEPHLQRSLAVRGSTVRFQGCRAARHDDHVHFQVSE